MTQTVPKGFVRAYLRASTTEQDATRALDTINTFAIERGLSICNYYIENESGKLMPIAVDGYKSPAKMAAVITLALTPFTSFFLYS